MCLNSRGIERVLFSDIWNTPTFPHPINKTLLKHSHAPLFAYLICLLLWEEEGRAGDTDSMAINIKIFAIYNFRNMFTCLALGWWFPTKYPSFLILTPPHSLLLFLLSFSFLFLFTFFFLSFPSFLPLFFMSIENLLPKGPPTAPCSPMCSQTVAPELPLEWRSKPSSSPSKWNREQRTCNLSHLPTCLSTVTPSGISFPVGFFPPIKNTFYHLSPRQHMSFGRT